MKKDGFRKLVAVLSFIVFFIVANSPIAQAQNSGDIDYIFINISLFSNGTPSNPNNFSYTDVITASSTVTYENSTNPAEHPYDPSSDDQLTVTSIQAPVISSCNVNSLDALNKGNYPFADAGIYSLYVTYNVTTDISSEYQIITRVKKIDGTYQNFSNDLVNKELVIQISPVNVGSIGNKEIFEGEGTTISGSNFLQYPVSLKPHWSIDSLLFDNSLIAPEVAGTYSVTAGALDYDSNRDVPLCDYNITSGQLLVKVRPPAPPPPEPPPPIPPDSRIPRIQRNPILVPPTPKIVPNKVAIQIIGNSYIYDGSPKNVIVITDPPGIPVSITYRGKAEPPIKVGRYQVRVLVIKTDTYLGATKSSFINILRASPILIWPKLHSIRSNAPLTAKQLSPISNIPGKFIFKQPIGTLLSRGKHILQATFLAADNRDYTGGFVSTSIDVS